MSSTEDKLFRRLEAALKRDGIQREHSLLVGLSGGGDSVALLTLLAGLAPQRTGVLGAFRLAHGLRDAEEEARETRFCRDLCRRLSLPFHSRQLPPGQLAEEAAREGRGGEQAARTRRHELLEETRREGSYDFIVLGHTAEDRLETILMRLFRGSGPEGLKGIPSRRGTLLRPLLGFSRGELRDYLIQKNISWQEDPSNGQPLFLRNRVRHELVPLLDSLFSGWPRALGTLGERAAENEAALACAEKEILPLKEEGQGSAWEQARWDKAPGYFQARGLWAAFDRALQGTAPDKRLAWRDIQGIREALEKGRSWSGGGLRVWREGDLVRAESQSPAGGAPSQGEWRVLLSREEAAAGFSLRLGGVCLAASRDPRFQEAGQILGISCGLEDWPLLIQGGEENFQVFTRQSGPFFSLDSLEGGIPSPADDTRELVYISINST